MNYKKVIKLNIEKENNELKSKIREFELEHYHDPLTGLQNRNALIKNLQIYDAPKLMIIDINRFSSINNLYGGKVGDLVLKKVASILENVMIYGCVPYRLSADQFTLVKHGQSNITCKEAAKKVIDLTSKEALEIELKDSTHIDINISVTIAVVKDIPKEKLIEYADMTLKYAKKTHQPFVFYSKKLNGLINTKDYKKALNAVEMVKSALDENRLIPFFQPIIKKDEVSYECLVRIIENDRIISPYYFIDEIKYTPYYTQLTKIMIDKAFEYFKDKENSFSINLSFEDILNTHIVEYITKKLQKTNMAERFIIEILESESIDNFNIVKQFIQKMKSFGVRIALDDFGSGYSNFSYLLELQPDYIKIDGSLIKNIDRDVKSEYIVKSIAGFAKQMDIKTIAEFIHNENVYEKAKALNIYGYQGFFLGEPNENIQSG